MAIYNSIDLILLKDPSLNRKEVEKYFSIFVNTIVSEVKSGKSVVIPGMCTFTWKQKAKTKTAAKEWTEFPYLAEGNKVRLIDPISDEENELSGKGTLLSLKKE